MGLSRIVGCPVLRIGPLDRFPNCAGLRDCRRTVRIAFAGYDKFNRENVLALHPARLVVGAGAMGRFMIRADGVAALSGLRRHKPSTTFALDIGRCRYL